MAKEKDPFEDLENEENIPQANWFKFQNVGDAVAGVVLEMFEKESQGDFPAQRCFLLKKKDGEEVYVGIKRDNDYLMGRTNKVSPGDVIMFKFEKEIPPRVKGHHPAKSIQVFLKKGAGVDMLSETDKNEKAEDEFKNF